VTKHRAYLFLPFFTCANLETRFFFKTLTIHLPKLSKLREFPQNLVGFRQKLNCDKSKNPVKYGVILIGARGLETHDENPINHDVSCDSENSVSKNVSQSVQREILEMFLTLDDEAQRWTFEMLAKFMREEVSGSLTG
jgi:hypothetical protein